MQRNKSTKKAEQIEKACKETKQMTENLSSIIDKFSLKSIFGEFDKVKRCGVSFTCVTLALLILPFKGVASVSALFKSGLNKTDAGMKDVYYDLKNNEKINWRKLLYSLSKRFKFLTSKTNEELSHIRGSLQEIKAMIFDDSTLEKSGRFIEGVGYVHCHVSHGHVLGYKLLVCGFWDGTSFIPLDFSLHKEKRDRELKKAEERLNKMRQKITSNQSQTLHYKTIRKEKKQEEKTAKNIYNNKPGKTNKANWERKQRNVRRIEKKIKDLTINLKQLQKQARTIEEQYTELRETYKYCGLKNNDYKNQFKKKRDRSSAGYAREKESGKTKIDIAISMFKRALYHGYVPDFVITDTWFFCKKFLEAVTNTKHSVHLLSMARIGTAKYLILPDDKLLNPHQIIAKYERTKGKTSRKYKARYIALQAEYMGIRVKIFLIKFGTHGSWRLLVTTDLNMSFVKMIQVYKIRWTIEVFFKECKQYLLLGRCQSQDFDAQIADITLSMIRYILLSYYQRIHYGMTIGGLFRKLSQDAITENLLADIGELFIELLELFADLAGIDFMTLYPELLRNPKATLMLERIGINQYEKKVA